MLVGRVFKSKTSRFWVAEAPAIGVHAEGMSRVSAEAMLVAEVQKLVQREDFAVTITYLDGENVMVDATSPHLLAAQVLKCQREERGLSLAAVAKRLGVASRNAYAAYEQGKTEPTLSKYLELLRVVAPEMALTVGPRARAKLPVKVD